METLNHYDWTSKLHHTKILEDEENGWKWRKLMNVNDYDGNLIKFGQWIILYE